MGIIKNRKITEDLLKIVKNGFEEQKNIKILSLYHEDDIIYGIYILPLSQSLSFNQEPLLNMTTDIDGFQIIMHELGQILLYAYNIGILQYFDMLTHNSEIDIKYSQFDELLNLCIHNPPLHRIDASIIEWLTMTDYISSTRIRTFNKICYLYNNIDSLNADMNINSSDYDDTYVLQQFNDVAKQLQHKNHKKIEELIIHKINDIYIRMQIDLYMTDNKKNTTKT